MTTIKAGTVLLHGTNSVDFDERYESLRGPSWLTNSRTVAEYFARRSVEEGATPRILSFRVTEDLELHEIRSPRAMQDFAEEHGISLTGVEDMRDTVETSGIPGWVIPNNYPDGDDILIADAGSLEHFETLTLVDKEQFMELQRQLERINMSFAAGQEQDNDNETAERLEYLMDSSPWRIHPDDGVISREEFDLKVAEATG